MTSVEIDICDEFWPRLTLGIALELEEDNDEDSYL